MVAYKRREEIRSIPEVLFFLLAPPKAPMTKADHVFLIRPLETQQAEEIEIVAQRMRLTLVEVLGRERGEAMYSLDWLRERARWHLDRAQCHGQIFVAEHPKGEISGHTIVRVEGEGEDRFGLFSTTYVAPEHRRAQLASALIQRGEAWMKALDLTRAVTYTDKDNRKLIGLFEKFGYTLRPQSNDMVSLEKGLCD